jgi:hypothetical protein
MVKRKSGVTRILLLVGIYGAVACSGGPVTAPDGLRGPYTGEWIGTTSQGASIAFSVSAQNIVTSITIGHNFNGCRDTRTFPNLSVPIGESDLPGRVPTPSGAAFGFGSGSPEAPDFVQVIGQFSSSRMAHGTVTFLNFEKCGNAVATWNATTR